MLKLKHLNAAANANLYIAMEGENSSSAIKKISGAFQQLKDSFSKKLEAKQAEAALSDIKTIKSALVDIRTKLPTGKFNETKVVGIGQALSKMGIKAASASELIEKLKKHLAVMTKISEQTLKIESLKNEKDTDKKKQAQTRLKELKEEYAALMEKPDTSVKMTFTKSQVTEIVNLGIRYCEQYIDIHDRFNRSKIAMEGVTDQIQGMLEWVVELFVDTAAFFYSIFSGLIRFISGIFVIILILNHPVAGVIVIIGAAVLSGILKDIQNRSGEKE